MVTLFCNFSLQIPPVTQKTDRVPTTCAPNDFQCHDGTCIPRSKLCDGNPDCSDYSDENSRCNLIVSLCILALVNCSLFDVIQIVENKDGNVRVRVGNSSAHSVQQFLLRHGRSEENNETSFINCSTTENQLCLNFTDGTSVTISSWKDECVSVNYSTRSNPDRLKLSFDFQDVHGYGGPLMNDRSVWPLRLNGFYKRRYMQIESDSNHRHYSQAVLEPYWLFSNGYYAYLYVDNNVYTYISSDSEDRFELTVENYGMFGRYPPLALNFALCKLNDAREAHEHAVSHFLGKPSRLPGTREVIQPVWTTLYSPYKLDDPVNQSTMINLAEKIIENGYGGKLVIGHKWEKYSGSFEPDTSQFPDFSELIKKLKNLNFTLALLVHPFVSESVELSEQEMGYLVQTNSWYGQFPGFTSIYDSGSYIDFKNPDALKWLQKRLMHHRRIYDIDSFQFESGFNKRVLWNTSISNQVENLIQENTNMLASLHVNIVTNVARGTQKYGFYLKMPLSDITSSDTYSSAILMRTVIPRLLHMNILGYSFTMPMIIGVSEFIMSSEIFIRWVQLNVFMPSMQFSIHRPPWYFGEKVANLTKKFVDLHAHYSPYIIQLMKENVKTGAPVNPPIWWISPNDSVALGCRAGTNSSEDDNGQSVCEEEFLLGDRILVAPVIKEGQKKRDVYLPAGFWRDGNSRRTFNGPIWVKDYPADLDTLPYFLRFWPDAFPTEKPHDCSNSYQITASAVTIFAILLLN